MTLLTLIRLRGDDLPLCEKIAFYCINIAEIEMLRRFFDKKRRKSDKKSPLEMCCP